MIEIVDVPDEIVRLLDERVSENHYAGRSEYVRDLLQRDLSVLVTSPPENQPEHRTLEDIKKVFARIEARNMSNIQPLTSGADSREAIYGDGN